MAITLHRSTGGVLDKWEAVPDHAAAWQQPREEVGRGRASQLAEISVQMRLVVVARLDSERPQAAGCSRTRAHTDANLIWRAIVFGASPTSAVKRAARYRRLHPTSVASVWIRAWPPVSRSLLITHCTAGVGAGPIAARSSRWFSKPNVACVPARSRVWLILAPHRRVGDDRHCGILAWCRCGW